MMMMIGMRMILMGMMNFVAVMVDRQKSFISENPILIQNVMKIELQFGWCRYVVSTKKRKNTNFHEQPSIPGHNWQSKGTKDSTE